MGEKENRMIDACLQQIDALERLWSAQSAEMQNFQDEVEPLYNRIEEASALALADKKITLEFTPDELETLMEAVGCAFEFHGYRKDSEIKSLRLKLAQKIAGKRTKDYVTTPEGKSPVLDFDPDTMRPTRVPFSKDERTKFKMISAVLGLELPDKVRREIKDPNIGYEFIALTGMLPGDDETPYEIPEELMRFFSEDWETLKRNMLEQETIPVSKTTAYEILAEWYGFEDVQACRRKIGRLCSKIRSK